jgi:NAD+ synthase (glutamine-hydrolysing)
MVGGQDELVYDGGSLVMDRKGNVIAQAPMFEEKLLIVDMDVPKARGRAAETSITVPALKKVLPLPTNADSLSRENEIYTALTLGTRDYVQKNGFGKVVIGLSGGIDSALVATIAVDALGKENVVGVTLPSRFNSTETKADAELVAKNLGIDFLTMELKKRFSLT